MDDDDRTARARLVAPELASYLGDDDTPLTAPRCDACERVQWPPRPFCADCGGTDFSPQPAAPVGTLYSWTTTHLAPSPEFADQAPYTVVIVELDEHAGVRLLGRLADTRNAPPLTVGMPMRGAREHDNLGRPLLIWRIDD